MNVLQALLEVLKLAPRYLVALTVASAFLLFAKDDWLNRLGVLKFTEDYRPWLGITLILTGSLFAVSVFIDGFRWLQGKRRRARLRDLGLQRLQSLTEEEKQILRFYIAKKTRTNVLRIDDGVVQGLVNAGIIYRAASVGDMLEGFANNISTFAWEYLNQHPEVLNGTTRTYRTDKSESFW